MYYLVLYDKKKKKHSFFAGYDPSEDMGLRWAERPLGATKLNESRAFELLRYVRLHMNPNDLSAFVYELS